MKQVQCSMSIYNALANTIITQHISCTYSKIYTYFNHFFNPSVYNLHIMTEILLISVIHKQSENEDVLKKQHLLQAI